MTPTLLVLAPIRGITDSVYRAAHAELFGGLDRAVAPFVREKEADRLRPAALADVAPERNPLLPVEPQILGKSPERFLFLAEALRAQEHESVSWNLGCPSRSATTGGRGAALLRRPDLVEAFLDAVVPWLPLRLTVKARLGREDEGELLALLPILERYSVSELTIHPRTAADGFDGPLRLDAFERCLEASSIPVLWSGEIRVTSDLDRLRARFPTVSGWMLGRGLLADPWLAQRLRERSAESNPEALRRLHAELLRGWKDTLSGPSPVLARMVAFWTYLGPSLDGGSRMLKTARKARSLGRYEEAAERFFDGEPRWLGVVGG